MNRHKKIPASITLMIFVVTLGLGKVSAAENPPPELKNLLMQIDTDANQENIKGVMQYYSPSFTSGDGLNRKTLEKSLTAFWKRYPRLHYSTELESWKSQGNSFVAETVTKITGLPSPSNNNMALSTTITSRQRVTRAKIVTQSILSELTQLTSGRKPPQVTIQLPKQVKVGQKFSFDAIVKEPIGDDYLLGAALQEPIEPDKYLNPTTVDLEVLTSGGLFKEGQAPLTPGSQWISAVILRGDGVTMITQRLQVVRK